MAKYPTNAMSADERIPGRPMYARQERIASQMLVAYGAIRKIEIMTDLSPEQIAQTIGKNAELLSEIIDLGMKLKSLKANLIERL